MIPYCPGGPMSCQSTPGCQSAPGTYLILCAARLVLGSITLH
ncbi:unnamed protein product [Staurois parvus]|uniref:Uncharacterized protein n=1 Tax=Staurois parvus TaxID=386267 RepID=A0ABN9ESR7_9NEOB|nr:unnamed protein product [Staurois parvus]